MFEETNDTILSLDFNLKATLGCLY